MKKDGEIDCSFCEQLKPYLGSDKTFNYLDSNMARHMRVVGRAGLMALYPNVV